MSDIVKSLILGIVQGLTEFLPISSSGHLELANYLLGSSEAVDSDLTMVIIVHFGTALSIIYIFFPRIIQMITSVCTAKNNEHTSLSLKIIWSMIPAVIIGLVFEEQIDKIFSGSITIIGVFLAITGIVLMLTPKLSTSGKTLGYQQSFIIGLAQAFAILPGISRSGMTIASALFQGIDRKMAADFSFLMVLPIILGKVFLDITTGEMSITSENLWPIIVALVSSFIVGVWACRWMIQLVQKSQLGYFGWYCIILGVITVLGSLYA